MLVRIERKEIQRQYEDDSSVKLAFRRLSTSIQRVSTRFINVIEEELDHFHPEDTWNMFLIKITKIFVASEKRIISYKNVFKEAWDVFIIILAIYNSLVIPLEMAFEIAIFETLAYRILDNLLDLIFLIDIVLTFFTSFLSNKGKEIKIQRLIALKYIPTTRFLYDCLSLLGANVFQVINDDLQFL